MRIVPPGLLETWGCSLGPHGQRTIASWTRSCRLEHPLLIDSATASLVDCVVDEPLLS